MYCNVCSFITYMYTYSSITNSFHVKYIKHANCTHLIIILFEKNLNILHLHPSPTDHEETQDFALTWIVLLLHQVNCTKGALKKNNRNAERSDSPFFFLNGKNPRELPTYDAIFWGGAKFKTLLTFHEILIG